MKKWPTAIGAFGVLAVSGQLLQLRSSLGCNCVSIQKFNHYDNSHQPLPATCLVLLIHVQHPPLAFTVKMMRTGAVRALYAVTRTQTIRQVPAFRSQISTSLLQSSRVTPSFVAQSIRCYSAPAGLSKDEVQGRIMDLLKNFDKVRREII